MSMTQAGKYKLKKPLVFFFKRTDEGVCDMYNEPLELHIYGDDEDECMGKLEDELVDWVLLFTNYPKKDISPSSIETFEKMKEFVDVEEIKNDLKKEEGL